MPLLKNEKIEPRNIKIAIIWTQLSGYLNACLKELASDQRIELFVSYQCASLDAPYDNSLFSWINKKYEWVRHPNKDKLLGQLEAFSPDLILCSGWNVREHRVILRHFNNKSIRLISLDNPWMSTIKQYVGILISKFYLHPICDALFVAGERQAAFAKKLGFSQRQILRGVLSCDFDKFSEVFFQRNKMIDAPKAFVFVGRLSKEKGLDVLVEAYAKYRQNISNPWPLKCYGVGEEAKLLIDLPGIELKGFVQPEKLPEEFLSASCLILPSKFEPWALVVHEAVTAGLGVICTDAVGASVHLVQKGVNGDIVETGSVDELASAMTKYSLMSDLERRSISQASHQIASQFTPKRWAQTLVDCALSGVES